ncbi:MAG TPA: sterol desaturase family protein [Flavisolibacter sp.]|jgi:sterol desaturase/sphingolipid hydroxylase (fatty acid hydroxylase superfamily)|nr:sterol desaturase family protein [Flavisolibacter sp.]
MNFIAPLIFLAVANHLIVFGFILIYKSKKIKRIYNLEASEEQVKEELMNSYLTSPLHAVLIWLALYSGFLKDIDTNWLNFIYTFLIVFVWTEIWHYFSHRLMHHKSLLWIHREHHKSKITNPVSSISFSFLEKLIFSVGIIAPVAALSHTIPISVYGIIAYYLFYFVTNVLGHSNIEIRKPGYANTWIGRIINTPAYHAMHHARYVKNYGLITSTLDRLFNTMWEDYEKVQSRAAMDQPLTKLSERLVPKKSINKSKVDTE